MSIRLIMTASAPFCLSLIHIWAMFKGTEPTKYIQLAYLTGILPVKKEKTQSALNNFKDYSMLHAGPIAPYVGFTETEVQKLCEVYGQKFEEVKR